MIAWERDASGTSRALDDYGRHLVISDTRGGTIELYCDKHRVGVFHAVDVAKLCAEQLPVGWQPARDPRFQHTGFQEPR